MCYGFFFSKDVLKYHTKVCYLTHHGVLFNTPVLECTVFQDGIRISRSSSYCGVFISAVPAWFVLYTDWLVGVGGGVGCILEFALY